MIYLISIFGIFFVVVVVNELLNDTKNEVWNLLVSKYGEFTVNKSKGSYRVQMIFFKSMQNTEYDYFNSMKIAKREDGIEFQPTINHCILKPIFLPYSNLEKIGKERLWLLNRTIYKVSEMDVYIGII